MKKVTWFFSLFILLAITPGAQAEVGLAFGFHNIYELELNGAQYSRVTVPNFEVSYLFSPNWKASGEIRQMNSSNGNSSFAVTQERWEMMAWGQYIGDLRSFWQPLVGLGAGWTYQKVKTTLYSDTRKDTGSDLFKLGIRGGCQFWLSQHTFLEAVGQYHWWNTNPVRSWNLGLLFGFQY